MTSLEINKDYGFVFGLDGDKGQKMIYKGGNTWVAVNPAKGEMTRESEKTTASVLEYINRPSTTMGSL